MQHRARQARRVQNKTKQNAPACLLLARFLAPTVNRDVLSVTVWHATQSTPNVYITRVGPNNKRINNYFSHEKSCGQKRSRRVAKPGGDMGFPRLGLGSLRVRRLRISQGGATIPRQRLGSCSAGVHRPRLTILSPTHPPHLVMAASTLAVTASAAVDPRPCAGTIRQATNQLALATPPPRSHGAVLPNYTSTAEAENRLAQDSRHSTAQPHASASRPLPEPQMLGK